MGNSCVNKQHKQSKVYNLEEQQVLQDYLDYRNSQKQPKKIESLVDIQQQRKQSIHKQSTDIAIKEQITSESSQPNKAQCILVNIRESNKEQSGLQQDEPFHQKMFYLRREIRSKIDQGYNIVYLNRKAPFSQKLDILGSKLYNRRLENKIQSEL